MTTAPATVLEEPTLTFGKGGTDIDPRAGMERHGPYHPKSQAKPTPGTVSVGIVATSLNATLAKRFLRRLAAPILSENPNKWLSPHYPGFNSKTSVACDFITSDQWSARITDHDLKALEKYSDDNQRIAACANLYVQRIRALLAEEPKPDVILCVLPEWIEDYCGRSKFTRGASRRKPTSIELKRQQNHTLTALLELEEPEYHEHDYDLRNAIKGKAMHLGRPIQILRESSANAFLRKLEKQDAGETSESHDGIQAPAEFAWNIATALYYKANGRPWRLAELTPGTCYIGIAFYHNKRGAARDMQFSMAQVFTHNLEGFVVRGTEVTIDERTREAFMSERQAYDLVQHAIEKYTDRARAPPQRVVIHKTSRFSDHERRGVLRAIGNVPFDLVSFRRAPLRFLRAGTYPVLRGTVISLSPTQHLLYTSGYVPRLRTYPGARVPEPLLLTHDGDSEFEHVCNEILGLTKLDWNSTTFYTSTPITISFAQRVGDVFSERTTDEGTQDHYRFYM